MYLTDSADTRNTVLRRVSFGPESNLIVSRSMTEKVFPCYDI